MTAVHLKVLSNDFEMSSSGSCFGKGTCSAVHSLTLCRMEKIKSGRAVAIHCLKVAIQTVPPPALFCGSDSLFVLRKIPSCYLSRWLAACGHCRNWCFINMAKVSWQQKVFLSLGRKRDFFLRMLRHCHFPCGSPPSDHDSRYSSTKIFFTPFVDSSF